MATTFIAPDIPRSDYERGAQLIASQLNVSVDDFKANYIYEQATLKMGKLLSPSLTQYQLSPRKGVDTPVPGTVLLDMNDFFIATDVSLRIGRATYASGAFSNFGNYPVFSYPDPNYFTGNGTTAGSEVSSLQCLVNGTLGFSVNGTYLMDPLPAQDFFFNPMSTYLTSPVTYPQFGGSFTEKGYQHLTPNIMIDAGTDNSFVVTLNQGTIGNIDGSISSTTTDSGFRNHLYIFVAGFKIKNLASASVKATSL